MRKAHHASSLALVISLLLSDGPASALVGADLADRTVQRFTKAVALAAHYNWIRETVRRLSAP